MIAFILALIKLLENLKKECSDFFEKLDEDKDGKVSNQDLKKSPTYAVIFNNFSNEEINLEGNFNKF